MEKKKKTRLKELFFPSAETLPEIPQWAALHIPVYTTCGSHAIVVSLGFWLIWWEMKKKFRLSKKKKKKNLENLNAWNHESL